ncbi:MAG TPA: zinc ribbon domain-containing protein [Steroidobacteraceae bacterium]
MPFYEYQCTGCGHELEAMQKVSDAPLKKCPHCGKSRLTRLMSAPVFRLKGGGWYETDFKGDKDKQRNLAERPDDAPKDAKDETKAKDEKGKDGKDAKSGETKADTPSAKEAPAGKEKAADKPADKSSRSDAQKPASARGGGRRVAPSKRKPLKVKRRR